MQFESTAYGPPWDAMEGSGITSKGVKLRAGQQKLVVAVDPTVIPYGTKMKIWPNPFGDRNLIFTAADTGGAFQGGVRKIDFFVASGRKAQNAWGRRGVSVQIVGRGSPTKVAILGQSQPKSVTQRRVPQGSRMGGAVTGVDPSARRQLILDYARQRGRPGALLDLVGGLQAQSAETPSVSRSGGSSVPSVSRPSVTPRVTYAAGSARSGVGPTSLLKNFVNSTAGHTRTGRVTVGTTTNHNQFTTTGNVSDHWSGNGADIPMPVDSSAGDNMAAHALQAAGVSWKKAIGMARQGGAWTITPSSGPYKGRRIQIIWKTNVGGNHHNHVHIGVR